jgi:hypothetical protein
VPLIPILTCFAHIAAAHHAPDAPSAGFKLLQLLAMGVELPLELCGDLHAARVLRAALARMHARRAQSSSVAAEAAQPAGIPPAAWRAGAAPQAQEADGHPDCRGALKTCLLPDPEGLLGCVRSGARNPCACMKIQGIACVADLSTHAWPRLPCTA